MGPKSWEYKGFPYREEVELMPPKSWGFPPYWEGESPVVRSLCVVRKIFPYRNTHVDHTRPRGTRWYASLSISVICLLGMEMYPSTSHGSVRIPISFCWCKAQGSEQTFLRPMTPSGIGVVSFIIGMILFADKL